jgi:hypothetical protein
MTIATVTTASGESFDARVTELRPNSILLTLERPLQFRDRVKVAVLGTELEGEVVFASELNAALTFAMTPEIFELIEEFEAEAPLPELPVLSPTGVLEAADDLEMLGYAIALLGGRALVVRAERLPVRARLRRGDLTIVLDVSKMGEGLAALTTDDRAALERAIGSRKGALGRFGDRAAPSPVRPPPASTTPPPLGDVPVLGNDGKTVLFTSKPQYENQFRINIEKGALVVKMDPLPPGTKRDLQLMIPGAPMIAFTAQSVFQGPGSVGFSIDLTDSLKAQLKAALDGSTVPAILYEAELAPPIDVGDLLSLSSKRPTDFPGAKRSYLRILDFLLASEREVRLRVTGEEEIVLWIYRGRVVFSQRKPEKEDDTIGRRLVASKVLSRSLVDGALASGGPGRTLGSILMEQGKLTQEDLVRELRQQILDRAAVPCRFVQGKLQVLPWSDPALKTKLLPVSGRHLLFELAKREVARWTLEEVCMGRTDLEVRIDLEKIDPSLRLGQKEERFYQRLAQAPAPFATAGFDLASVACALGFATLQPMTVRPRTSDLQRQSTDDILLEQLDRIEKGSPFDVLGIHWSATLREIRNAYEAERKKIVMRKRQEVSKDLVAKVEKKLEEAMRTLGTLSERKPLRERSADAMERQHAAEHLVQQAELALFREDFETATDLLDTADELSAVRRAKQLRAQLKRAEF